MSLICNQLVILLWKSWITRLRHWISTIFELLAPLLLALIIAYLYYKANSIVYEIDHEQHYPSTTPGEGSAESNPSRDDSKLVPASISRWPEYSVSLVKKRDDGITHGMPSEVYYAPSTPETDELMNDVIEANSKLTLFKLKTGEEVTAKLESLVANRETVESHTNRLGVIFDVMALNEGRLNYTVRAVNEKLSKSVNNLYPYKSHNEPAPLNNQYYIFCQLQSLINSAFVKRQFNTFNTEYPFKAINWFKFPYPSYVKSNYSFSLMDFIAATIAIGYVILCPLIVKRITDEKVAKAKEMLRMIGMSDWVFWLSHFISYFTIMVFHALVFTFLYRVGIGGYAIVEYTDWSLFFVLLVIYSAQTILFCMTLTTVFNRPVLAVIVTVIVWILSYAVPLAVLNPVFHTDIDVEATNKWRVLSLFLPNMGLNWALAILGDMENLKVGAHWSSLFHNTRTYGSLTLALVMFTMLLSCLIYMILIWYVDNVWPFQYGVPKPLYFPFKLSYWWPSNGADRKERPESAKSDLVIDTKNYEPEPESGVSISVANLTKTFGSYGFGRKTAVNNLSLNIYEKQITALLGHNGAGKTTTMNMITGIFPPTSGRVLVNGYDIQYETSAARKSIGLCPQENIYFNELTVGQHLKLFAILKGCSWGAVEGEVNTTLELLQLKNKIGELASKLSGGMKRKLMLGMALVGGTQILVLDEPTSGLDPEARRVVWDLLQKLTKNRTILLTTHYMEEADVLGDRIAIMCEGQVKCCGSPMFLKKRFGAGYHLRISKTKAFRKDVMEATLKRYLPKAHLHSEIQSEVIYTLESEEESGAQNTTAVFPQMFDEIEKNKDRLGINSCGLTITTMEDVFIRVGNEFEGTENLIEIKKNKDTDQLVGKRPEYITGFSLLTTQFYALLLKRFHYAKRYWQMLFFQILVPCLLFIMALITDNSIRNTIQSETKNLNLDLKELYGEDTHGFFKASALTSMQDKFVANAKSHGMETTVLKADEDPNNWALDHAKNLEEYSRSYLMGWALNKTRFTDDIVSDVWFNNEALHTLPIAINIFFESVLKSVVPPERQSQRLIQVHNYPLSEEAKAINFMATIFGWLVTALILVPITVPFLGASYVLFPISERVSKSKLLQLMTGLSAPVFWLSNFLFDLLNHSIVVVIIYIIFAIFDYNGVFFGYTNTAVGLLLMLFLFGFASIPLAYLFSLVFGRPATGFAVLVIIYLMFGLIAVSVMGSLDYARTISQTNLINENSFNVFLHIFRFVPVFSMSFGIQRLYRTSSFAKVCDDMAKEKMFLQVACAEADNKSIFFGCCKEKCGATNACYGDKSVLSFDNYGVGTEFVYLIGTGLLFMALLMIYEIDWVRKVWYSLQVQRKQSSKESLLSSINEFGVGEDSDVRAEKERINALVEQKKTSEEAMAVIDLTKHFGYFTAVDHLTFGVHKEECFGLLGVNGAGKTTTFSMLTGDVILSDGNAFIENYSLRSSLKSFQKRIGYCPQFDALLEKLTGVEMLYLFGRLRGIPSNLLANEVNSLIQMVDLQNHASKRTETYSGGNRRKLSLALSIIGSPSVVFLDEPTAGVDPTARRKIWSTLVFIQERYQSSIVLTSHSMEECEALCSRIGIMVNGKFKCLGPTQHLRQKFGQGFTIVVKLKREVSEDTTHVQKVKTHIQNALNSAVLKDIHQGLLHFHITDPSVKWSYMFAVMENAKQELQYEDYLVSDTTLEQIFLAFAKTQR